MKKLLISITLLILINPLSAQNKSTMTVDIVVNADYGWPTKIIIYGTAEDDDLYLGMSLYPYNITDALTGGRHSHRELNKGPFYHEIDVDQPLLGGSFEFAIWGKKVDKVDCTLDYCYWCKSKGFHFDDLRVYKSGLLNQMKGYQ